MSRRVRTRTGIGLSDLVRPVVLLAMLAAPAAALADITNRATASGTHAGEPVSSPQAIASVPLAGAAPEWKIETSAALAEGDGRPGLSAGDRLVFRVTVTNSGNVSIRGFRLDSQDGFALESGDEDGDGEIDRTERWEFVSTHALSQADLDRGGGGAVTFERAATARGTGLRPQVVRVGAELTPTPAARVAARLVSREAYAAQRFRVELAVRVANSGNVTLSALQLSQPLDSIARSGAGVLGAQIEPYGFAVPVRGAVDFDGQSRPDLLADPVRLAPGETGAVRLVLVVEGDGSPVRLETATVAASPELPAPARSATISTTLADSDGDGAPDWMESAQADRDGDGVPDAADFDPTGYFYCETDGRILKGGRIAVTNLDSGETQTGAGEGAGVAIERDGSDGAYQFHVTRPGRYRLAYEPPPTGATGTRMPAGPLRAEANPAIVGSGADGGRLSDFSAQANPFHVEFDLAPGRPIVFNNNIPLRHCGALSLSAGLEREGDTELLADGQARLRLVATARNDGQERINGVQLSQDLAQAFGAGRYTVERVDLVDPPAGFGGRANPFYDGADDTGLLTSGGGLLPGEEVGLRTTVRIDAPSGRYRTEVTASGRSPLDAGPVPVAKAAAETAVTTVLGPAELAAGMRAGRDVVQRGGAVDYRLTVSNRQSVDRGTVDVIDTMPEGFSYVAGSGRVDGVPTEPRQDGRRLVWKVASIPAGGRAEVDMQLSVGTQAAGEAPVNTAYVRAENDGAILSNIARAGVRIGVETAYDCVDVSGTVFRDDNGDGIRQPDEAGISGARVTGEGQVLAATGGSGQYYLTCPVIPETSGMAFRLAVDADSVPRELAPTTPNPASARVSRGDTVRLDFGFAPVPEVRLDLAADSFVPGRVRLTPAALLEIDRLIAELARRRARLRIVYMAGDQDVLATERVTLAARLVESVWRDRGYPYRLKVATQVENSGAEPPSKGG